MDIADIKKRLKRPELTEEICLDADLLVEHQELTRQLLEAQQTEASPNRKMGEEVRSVDLARQIQAVEERMAASVAVFRFRAVSGYELDELAKAHPPREDHTEALNLTSAKVPLVALSCVDPKMTLEDAEELYQLAGADQFNRLALAAWNVTNGGSQVPKSVLASAAIRASEQRQS